MGIRDEWERLELKIIPYKNTLDAYILVDTEMLVAVMDDHLTTLESVQKSDYAAHVRDQIQEWIQNLNIMQANLGKWVESQRNWIYLDPIFNTLQIQNVLHEEATAFLEVQSTFKRIMWSAYRKPKATYNLMIQNRVEVFEKLTGYFAKI